MKLDVEGLISVYSKILEKLELDISMDAIYLKLRECGSWISQSDLRNIMEYFVGELDILAYITDEIVRINSFKEDVVVFSEGEIKAYVSLAIFHIRNVGLFDKKINDF